MFRNQIKSIKMKEELREYSNMKQRLEDLEPAEKLNLLILIYADSEKDELEGIDLLQKAFVQYIVENNLPSFFYFL